MRNLGDKHI